jgi:hypothetical protein
MKPITIASARLNNDSSCHFIGDALRARSDVEKIATVIVDIKRDSMGMARPLNAIHLDNDGYLANRRTDRPTNES